MTDGDKARMRATDSGADDDEAEVEAISAVVRILKPFSPPAKRRVISFVADKYGVGIVAQPNADGRAKEGSGGTTAPTALPEYKLFAQLVNRVRPATEIHKVLLAAYWAQQVEKVGPFATKQIYPRLTEISVGLGHVTERLQDLQDLNPSLVIHTVQAGQSKKSFLVTEEGVAAVESAIRTGGFPTPARKGTAS
jgi:hypothetical protein